MYESFSGRFLSELGVRRRFQGMEEDGLKLLAEAKEASGLPIVTEIMNPREIELVIKYADVLQVGARNMQNFSPSFMNACFCKRKISLREI